LITIPGSSSYASDAPFSVFDGTTLLKTVLVNERSTLGNCGADGLRWQNLGTFTIHGGTLVVQLTNRAGGQVAADAVKIERVTSTPDPNPPTPPKPSPDPHHEKDNGSNKGDHGDSHKTPPRHQPAHSAPQPAKSSTKPSPKHDDPAWLHGLAKDVAKLHSAKPHK